jgi:DNA-directed RNA polymerase subunit L
MKINVLKNESNELILEFETGDVTIPDLLANHLLQNEDVEFAGVSKDHPEIGKPKLVIKTNKKKVIPLLLKAIDEIDDNMASLKTQISGKK